MPSIYLNGRKYSGSGTQGANGKNAQVAKIEPIVGGNRVTFTYYDDAQVMQNSSVEIMNGVDGVSITSARVDNGNTLVLGLSDGNEITAGTIAIDSSNLNLDGYYDAQTIDTLLAVQKSDLETYVDITVETKVEEKVDGTVGTVSSDDITNLF